MLTPAEARCVSFCTRARRANHFQTRASFVDFDCPPRTSAIVDVVDDDDNDVLRAIYWMETRRDASVCEQEEKKKRKERRKNGTPRKVGK